MEESECSFCGQKTPESLRFLGRCICPNCEGQLTRIQPDDPDYPIWMQNLRRIWEEWYKTVES